MKCKTKSNIYYCRADTYVLRLVKNKQNNEEGKIPKFKMVIASGGGSRERERKEIDGEANVHVSSWVGSLVFVLFLCSVT